MLRLLLILVLLFYVLYKLGLFRAVMGGVKEGYRQHPGSNVNVDATPQKEKRKPTATGGEYIDYEEVKDS
ncbi:hypothetical protein QQ054_11925 [Oscillatoria amoena NRMC-F 0135]|nr:hypothetical protein [Oscillatoria amoena NRMC-F 0135]